MDLEMADGGRNTRGPQYTKNDTDFYVSAAAEDSLVDEDDSHNPFKQDPTQQPILDPDEAALAALNGTCTTSNTGPKVASTVVPEPTLGEGVKKAEEESPADDNPGEGSSKERRRSSAKRSRADSSLDAEEAGEPFESEDAESSQPVDKKACRHRDSDNPLVIKPDDTVQDEDRKMRANMQRVGTEIDPEDDRDQNKDQQDNGGRTNNSTTAEESVDDDFDLSKSTDPNNKEENDQLKRRPPTKSDNEVKPVPLMDQLTLPKTSDEVNQEIPRDVGDDDDDIEAKMDDDYDVENYAEYEDDQDDVGQEMKEDGPDMDERLMVDEELFGPSIVGEDGEDVMGR
ncbi:hypothetical protein V8F06_014170 [Rhypophila decipiens]